MLEGPTRMLGAREGRGGVGADPAVGKPGSERGLSGQILGGRWELTGPQFPHRRPGGCSTHNGLWRAAATRFSRELAAGPRPRPQVSALSLTPTDTHRWHRGHMRASPRPASLFCRRWGLGREQGWARPQECQAGLPFKPRLPRKPACEPLPAPCGHRAASSGGCPWGGRRWERVGLHPQRDSPVDWHGLRPAHRTGLGSAQGWSSASAPHGTACVGFTWDHMGLSWAGDLETGRKWGGGGAGAPSTRGAQSQDLRSRR